MAASARPVRQLPDALPNHLDLSIRCVLPFTNRILEAFYSCFIGKFFAKAAPGRKLAGDQWPIRIRGAQYSFSKDAIA